MRIIVRDPKEGSNIRLWFPTGLIFNCLTARLGAIMLPQYGMDITPAQIQALFDEFHRAKKNFPQMPLVEVDSADGTYVRIIL